MRHLHLSFHLTGLIILGFLLGLETAAAQPATGGARAVALGGAVTALEQHPWNTHNPALPATLKHRHVELFGSQGFNLRELRFAALTYAEPLPWGTFSLTAQTFGFEQYREVQVGGGYAQQVASSVPINVGVLVLYKQTAVAHYGRTSSIGASLGGFVRVSPTFALGLQAANLHQQLSASAHNLRQLLALGFLYRPTAKTRLLFDINKQLRFPLSVRAGLEFKPIPQLALRTGLATAPRRFTAGFGLFIGPLHSAFSLLHHYALGLTPATSLGIDW